ncbi:MAG: Type II secretion system protein, partial [Candidatus Wolfebacteria bacterium GW2011_GWC1_37_10]
MATFIYEASDKAGLIVKGKFDAQKQEDVFEYLEKKELIPILVEKEGEGKIKKLSFSFAFFETVSPTDRILLVRNLAATIKAGLNIIESLDILIMDASKNLMKAILGQAKFNLQRGQPLSATFSYYKKYFPPVFFGLIRAGEASGRLDATLEELSRYLIKEHNLNRKIKSALAYPLILLIASIGVIALLLFFVLPRLTKSFKSAKMELPLITKILLGISNFLVSHPIFDLAMIAGIVGLIFYFKRTDWGRRTFILILLKIPVVKELVKKVALVRFTRTLSSLLASGLTAIEGLTLSIEAVGNDFYKRAILESVESIKRGVPISKSFRNYTDLFPNLLINMIA